MYSTTMSADFGLIFSSTNMSRYHSWHSQPNTYFPSIAKRKSFDDEMVLDKFHYNTTVQLESGHKKSIQQITTNDFLLSTKQSPKYAG